MAEFEIISREEARERGLKRFFTGEPCKYGHVAERYVSTGACVECARLNAKRWQDENREKYKDYQREWRKANPEKVKGYRKKQKEA